MLYTKYGGKEEDKPMGNKFVRKMIASLVAAALVITSGIGVFAAGPSSEVGKVKKVHTYETHSVKTIKISFPAVKNASGYAIYVNGKKVATTDSTSYLFKGKKGKTYKIQVAAIAKDGKTIGKKSKVSKKTLSMRWMKGIKVKKVKRGKKKGTVVVTWKKVKKATGYQIEYSKDKKNWKSKYVKGGKVTKKTLKGLKKGKWYIKIRPIKGNYLGALSKAYKVKVK